MYTTAILTISDRCFSGERKDESGPQIENVLPPDDYEIVERKILPDELDVIKGALLQLVSRGDVDLILTTGGTGFSPRDVTPEATAMVIQKKTLGIDHAIYKNGLQSTPHAILSRAISGIRNQTLIINLPGSPQATKENLVTIMPVLPHALNLIKDKSPEDEHQFE